MTGYYLGTDGIERYIESLLGRCAASINLPPSQPDGYTAVAPAEESSTIVCPLCRDVVPRSKPQCTSIVFCDSMPIRKSAP